jgi:hypothetical protein
MIKLACAFLGFCVYVAGTLGFGFALQALVGGSGANNGDSPAMDASALVFAWVGYRAASWLARLLKRPPENDPSGTSATRSLTSPARLTVAAVMVASVAIWPAFFLWLPEWQYVPPLVPGMGFILLGFPIWFATLLAWGVARLVGRGRWGPPLASDWQLWRRAWHVLWAAHAVSASTLTLRLAFLLSWPWAESVRLQADVEPPAFKPGWVGVYPVDGVGWVESDDGTRVFVVQRLEPPGEPFPGSGSGFFHLDPGQPIPPYNEGTTGELVGGWWWYTTD